MVDMAVNTPCENMEKVGRVLNDPEQREKDYALAMKIADGASACAITASVRLISAGIFPPDEIIPWAEDLATRLKKMGWKYVQSDVQANDLIVCQDLNGNGATDHVWFAVTDAVDGYCMCLDNHNEGKPYKRNLGEGSRTPMDYALRLV
jgi:hypothetical protein